MNTSKGPPHHANNVYAAFLGKKISLLFSFWIFPHIIFFFRERPKSTYIDNLSMRHEITSTLCAFSINIHTLLKKGLLSMWYLIFDIWCELIEFSVWKLGWVYQLICGMCGNYFKHSKNCECCPLSQLIMLLHQVKSFHSSLVLCHGSASFILWSKFALD